MDNPPFIHEKALVETADIGSGTRIWAFAHVMQVRGSAPTATSAITPTSRAT
jgi:hypothetical protein